MDNHTDPQRDYWDKRATGDVQGIKQRILARLFCTGYVGIDRIREIRFISANLSGTWILDAGCGNGSFLKRLNRRQPDRYYLGFDFSYPMVKIASEKGVRAVVMDMKNQALKDRGFETVFCVRSLKNIVDRYDQSRAIKEMCRISSRRVIIYDSFERPDETIFVPEFNLPLKIDHILNTFTTSGFHLSKRAFFPNWLFLHRTVEEQVSHYGCLVFDRTD